MCLVGATAQESILVPPLGHADRVTSIAASPDGNHILTAGGSDHTAMLWDSAGDLLLILRGHLGNVEHVEFSKDGKYLLTVDGAIRIWTTTGALLKDFPIHYKYTTACLTHDSRDVIAGGNDGKLLKTLIGRGQLSNRHCQRYRPDSAPLTLVGRDPSHFYANGKKA